MIMPCAVIRKIYTKVFVITIMQVSCNIRVSKRILGQISPGALAILHGVTMLPIGQNLVSVYIQSKF